MCTEREQESNITTVSFSLVDVSDVVPQFLSCLVVVILALFLQEYRDREEVNRKREMKR